MNSIAYLLFGRVLLLAVTALVAVGVVSRLAAPPEPAAAQASPPPRQQAGGDAGEDKKKENLPLTEVVVYTAGVGYFEHDVSLSGGANLQLEAEREEIDDLLKSLIVQDFGDGHVQLVTYDSYAPAEHTLQTFSLNLAGNPALPKLLEQARGETVVVHAPNAMTGKIISIETQKRPAGKDDEDLREVHVLNLLVEGAVKQIPLTSVQSLEFQNERLKDELQQALQVIARSHQSDRKRLQLNFTGKDKRRVRVAYIRPMPVWKMTYRLALSQKGDHVLQGWAIVENTTEEDWKDVSLSLVSGRPITYQMPLYQPLFVQRPTVKLDLYESLRPQNYQQNLAADKDEKADARGRASATAAAEQRRQMLKRNAAPAAAAGFGLADRAAQSKARDFDLRQGVEAVAQANELGELVEYRVREPVTLPRQQSALLPVVDASISGQRFSIYDETVHKKHPLYGLRLKNASDQYLMEGPITVFDDQRYAGDALLEGLTPGNQRLISYGIDLEVEVAPHAEAHPRSLRQLRIFDGAIHARYEQRQNKVFDINNRSGDEKSVLVTVAKQADWKLASPEADEVTRDDYRFLVKVPANDGKTLDVELRRAISEQIALTNLSHDALVNYVQSDEISDQARQAFQEIAQRKQAINQLQRRLQQAKQDLKDIGEQQERIRQNMQRLGENTDLYARYVRKLGDQEDDVERLRAEQNDLEDQIRDKQNKLNDFLGGLTLE